MKLQKIVIFSAILVLISIQFLYSRIGNGVEFFPEVEPDLSKIVIYARGNLSVDEKNDYVSRVENIILNIQKNNNEFKNIYSISGNVSEQSEDSEDFIGSVSLEYVDLEERRPSKIILISVIVLEKFGIRLPISNENIKGYTQNQRQTLKSDLKNFVEKEHDLSEMIAQVSNQSD